MFHWTEFPNFFEIPWFFKITMNKKIFFEILQYSTFRLTGFRLVCLFVHWKMLKTKYYCVIFLARSVIKQNKSKIITVSEFLI